MNGTALTPAIGLVFLCAFVTCTAWLAWWMLEPINRVAGALRATPRFVLTDVIGLMILLQVGLALIGRALSRREVGREAAVLYWILLAGVAILCTVLWAASVSVVSRAGITRPLRRIVVMVLLIPGALAVMVSLPASIVAVIVEFVYLWTHPKGTDLLDIPVALWAIGSFALAAAAVALRQLSYWALAGSPGEIILAQRRSSQPAER